MTDRRASGGKKKYLTPYYMLLLVCVKLHKYFLTFFALFVLPNINSPSRTVFLGIFMAIGFAILKLAALQYFIWFR